MWPDGSPSGIPYCVQIVIWHPMLARHKIT